MPKIPVEKPARLIYHNPVCLVTSKYGEAENVFTASWLMPVSNNPATVALSVGKTRYSHELIRKSRMFTLNIPNASMLKEVAYCGNVSGRDTNKFAEMRLQKETTAGGYILLPECIAYLECKVIKEIDISDRTLFIAEITANGVEEGLFERDNWRMLPGSEVLFYLGDGKYCTAKPLYDAADL